MRREGNPKHDKVHVLKNTLTIILAGGMGKRLYPLTKDRAKPAVPFGGGYRIIDFTLSNCLNSNLRRIFVLAQYMSQSLQRHIKLNWNVLNYDLGEFIEFIPPQQRTYEGWYKGTADAIFQNIFLLEQQKPQVVLILSGDHVYKMDYSKMVEFHIQKNAMATVACLEVPMEEGSRFGILHVDEDSRTVSFNEKPLFPEKLTYRAGACLASMGVYCFSTESLVRYVIQDAKRDSEHDFGKNIFPSMLDSGQLFAYKFEDENRGPKPYWKDIGTLDAYYEANIDLVSSDPSFHLYDQNWPVRGFLHSGPPVQILSKKENQGGLRPSISNVILSWGCVIRNAAVSNSILFPEVRVEDQAEVSDSILMDGVVIKKGARLKKVIIDKRVCIPERMEIGFNKSDDQKLFLVSPGGVTVVPKYFYIPSRPGGK